jgi:hypothetical protein
MEQRALKFLNNCVNTYLNSYLETSGGQSSNLYLNVVPFLTPVLVRHLWQLKLVVFRHWCLICAVLLARSGSTMVGRMTTDVGIKGLYPACQEKMSVWGAR